MREGPVQPIDPPDYEMLGSEEGSTIIRASFQGAISPVGISRALFLKQRVVCLDISSADAGETVRILLGRMQLLFYLQMIALEQNGP